MTDLTGTGQENSHLPAFRGLSFISWTRALIAGPRRAGDLDLTSVAISEARLTRVPLPVPSEWRISTTEVHWWLDILPVLRRNGFECQNGWIFATLGRSRQRRSHRDDRISMSGLWSIS